MSKMKLPILIVLLPALFCLSHSQEPTEYIDVTSSMSLFEAQYKYIPKVVTIRNQIYTVIIKKYDPYDDKFELLLNALDSSNQLPQVIRSCDLSIPDVDWFMISEVVALGNGKIVIVSTENEAVRRSWIDHIIIDPFDCSSQKKIRSPFTNKGAEVLALIPYYDSYDILYFYLRANSTGLPKNPYRYNDLGQKIELDYYLETPNNYRHHFEISTVKPFDASEGYYHSYYDRNIMKVVLQRLDSRFKKVKEIRLEDTSIHVSTTYGHINYCSFSDYPHPFCKFLNADLEVQVTSELPKLNFPIAGYVHERKVINLPKKGLVVFIAFQHRDWSLPAGTDHPYDFYLQWVSSDGSEVKTRKIGHASLKHKEDYKIVDTKKDFCHVTIDTHFFALSDDVSHVYNRCLDL